MWPDFFGPDGKPVHLLPAGKKEKQYLQGSKIHKTEKKNIFLRIEVFSHPLFCIGFRVLRFLKSMRLKRRETDEQLRLEAVLAGELPSVSEKGDQITLKAGEYHLTSFPEITALFKKDTACHYFVTHYSREFLTQNDLFHVVKPSPVRPLSDKMRELIHRMLNNPHEDQVRALHYDHCIREFMVLHLAHQGRALPSGISQEFLRAILTADSLLQQDLSVHNDIPTLASKVGTNTTHLKRGFKIVFKMGVFERLTFHRLNQAKMLLENSNRTIDDIAAEVGYATRNSFIAVFKRNLAITPQQWRIRSKSI